MKSAISVTFRNSDQDVTLFQLNNWSLCFRNKTDPTEGIWMTVVLKRKILSEMMITYLPSLLLLMITFATTSFKPFFFEAALTVNLTTMLVMTTIFNSKMEGLPPTSATKMIDYWLILCQLVPFVQVVLLTAMEFLRGEEQEGNQVSSKDKCLQSEPTNGDLEGNTHFDVEDDAKPKEAWTIATVKRSETSYVPMLAVIGRFLVLVKRCLKLILFQRRK